jgi:erythromycin esterase-like protein
MTTGITETVHPADAASLMKLLPTRPRLLAMGEPTHGEDILLELRNDLFRQLVAHEGYRTIAIESDCLAGLTVDDYITTGTGTLDDALTHGFSHGFGASPANRDLVHWMRTHNENRPADEHVHFAGFDGPLEITGGASPRRALTALHTYLAAHLGPDLLPCTAEALDQLIGDDDRWPNPEAMYDPAKSIGRTSDATRLRLLADDLAALLDTHAPHLATASSRHDRNRAHLHARTATGLLRYHHWMADTSPHRIARLLGVRASMMAANLLATIDENGPTMAYAHNGHLQRDKSSMRMGGQPQEWWSAGAIVAATIGHEYAVLATALGTIHHRGVDAPPPDTVEGLLYALPNDRYLVDAHRLATVLGDTTPPRVSPWFGYAPLNPAHLAGNDALVFVKDAPETEAWWPPAG